MINRYLEPDTTFEEEDPDPVEAERKRAAGYVPLWRRLSGCPRNTPSAASAPVAAPVAAVVRCAQAYEEANQAALDQRESEYTAERAGKKAYLKVMPPLIGRSNIRDFIACVSQAMCWEIIQPGDGTKLLYAAQVAYNTTKNLKKSKKSTKSPTKATTLAPAEFVKASSNE